MVNSTFCAYDHVSTFCDLLIIGSERKPALETTDVLEGLKGYFKEFSQVKHW